MENASNALIMAGGVLIAILILTLAVYLISSFGSQSAKMHLQIDEERLNNFNNQYASYLGKDKLTIYDVITVANMARENNKYYEVSNLNDSMYINVELKRGGYGGSTIPQPRMETLSDSDFQRYLEADRSEIIRNPLDETKEVLKNYDCTDVKYNPDTGRVNKVIFQEK